MWRRMGGERKDVNRKGKKTSSKMCKTGMKKEKMEEIIGKRKWRTRSWDLGGGFAKKKSLGRK